MQMPGQNTPPDQSGQAVPAPPAQEQKKQDDGGGGFIDGIRQTIIDNYNGLYKIVLKPRMPEGVVYTMAIIGMFFGLIWAYTAASIVFVDANPNRLNEGAQNQWLQMVAVASNSGSVYGDETAIALAQAIPNPRAQIEALIASGELNPSDQQALQTLLTKLPADIDTAEGTAQEITRPSILINLLNVVILPLILVVVITVVLILLWRFLIYDNIVAPILQRIREATDPEEAARAQKARDELKIQQEQRRLREELAAQASDSDLGEPIMTQLAIFQTGRSFDESYEIETEAGDFLGQSGAVIAEAVDPTPSAIEIWLFDMFSSRNIAKVFVTPSANSDPSVRSRIEADVDNPATDIIVAEPSKSLTIDTDKLRLQAKFASVNFDASGNFDKFNLQMRAWNKDEATAGSTPPMPSAPAPVPTMPAPSPAPSGAPDMSVYDDIQFDPPPAPPSGATTGSSGLPDMSTYDGIQFDPPPAPPSGSSGMGQGNFSAPPPLPSSGSGQFGTMQPLQPPPLMPDDDDDDDPFGGTGDFTPLGGR
ncbi:MAG: hypothetical protein AAFR81_06035 [Chloroflexota bacterium]